MRTLPIDLTREELVILSQALVLRHSTLRCTIMCHDSEGVKRVSREMKANQDLQNQVQSAIRQLSRYFPHED